MSKVTEYHQWSDSEESCSSDWSEIQDVSTYRWHFEPSAVNDAKPTILLDTCDYDVIIDQSDVITDECNNIGDRLICKSKNLAEDLGLITEIPDLCDVKFLVGKESEAVYAVKGVLAARSRCFYNLILSAQRSTDEKKNQRKKKALSSKIKNILRFRKPTNDIKDHNHLTITVKEFDWASFKRVICYLHTGKINIDLENVIGVLAVADVYGLDDLLTLCQQFTRDVISKTTVLSLLTSTYTYGDIQSVRGIRTEILSFIMDHAEAVLRQKEFEFLRKSAAEEILTCNNLKISDELRWEATLRWGRRHYRGQKLELFRESIMPFLSCIDFRQISVRKLAMEIRPLRVLKEDVIARAIAERRNSCDLIDLDSSDVIYSASPDWMAGDYRGADVSGYRNVIGSHSITDFTMSVDDLETAMMKTDLYGLGEEQSFINQNDLLDELLEEDSRLSAIFDVSMTSDA